MSGAFILAANTLVTVRYAVRVAITGTAESHPPLVNRACVYPEDGSLADCIWSNEIQHPTYGWLVYLPLVLRQYP